MDNRPAPDLTSSSLRRRVVFEVTAEEFALLVAGQRRYGTKRDTLVAGLRALDEERVTKPPVSG